MDPRLLRAYNDELVYLREAARAFGIEHAAVAGRLGLDAPGEPDPHVERLLEGVAFLGARVRLKLDDQFPDFTQYLLSALQPHYVAPTPSMCVVAFEPRDGEAALAEGVSINRGTQLEAVAGDEGATRVVFRTAQPVTLWPFRIVEAEYLPTPASLAGLAADIPADARAGLRLRIEAQAGTNLADLVLASLPIHLDGAEIVPGELYRQFIGDCVAVSAGRPDGPARVALPLPAQIGFDDEDALLPANLPSFRGYRLLAEYFAMPQRFHFVALEGLVKAFAGCTDRCDVVLFFRRTVPALAGAVHAGNFRLFAAPAINLFEKQLDRVAVSGFDHEWHVVADRARPLDFELFRILAVTAHGEDAVDGRPVAPLHDRAGLLHDWDHALSYSIRLRHRRLSTREQRARRRTDYLGTESWIGLTAPGDPQALDGVRELGVRALVTNRELPMRLRLGGDTDFHVHGVPVRAVRAIVPPTRPRPPLAIGDAAWRVIAHLTPNYSALIGTDGDASALREHLALYARPEDAAHRRQIDGVLAIHARPVMRRAPGAASGFVSGEGVLIRLDDASFDGARMFLFGAVVERFLAEFAAVNSFTQTAFESVHEGRIVQWPARLSRRRPI
ncbi:type VI secretion system protein ImpG [Sphingomonas zeicaulis]|uniref:type VI secretion system baseplate subunit TssF n=1 Tax=Sphingomonas zeicaulis TaxID=1632740 RepID=UPI003D1D1837